MEILRAGRWRLLLVCWLAWVCDFYSLVLYNFLELEICQSLLLSEGESSWIKSLSLFATAVGGVGVGWLADRVGRRPAFFLSIGLYGLGTGLTAFSSDFGTMLAARLITSLGVGGEWGVGQAVVAETLPLAMRGRAAGILQSGSPVATALAGLASGYLASGRLIAGLDWRGTFLISSASLLLVPAAWFVLPREPRRDAAHQVPVRELFQGALLRPSAVMFTLLCLNMAGYWCTYSYIYRHMREELGCAPLFVTHVQLVISAGHLFGNLSFGWFADRLARRAVLVVYTVLFAAGTLTVGLTFETLVGSLPLLVLTLAAVGVGAGYWSCFGALFADFFPARVRGTASSGFYNVSRGVQLVTTQAVRGLGRVADIPLGQAGLFLGSLFSALAAGAALALPERRDAEAEQSKAAARPTTDA